MILEVSGLDVLPHVKVSVNHIISCYVAIQELTVVILVPQ